MPYGKYNKSKKTYKSSRLTVSKVKKLVNQGINKRAEKKSKDIDHTTLSQPTSGTPTHYSDFLELAIGDGADERDGQQVSTVNCMNRLTLNIGSTSAVVCRLIWVFLPDDRMDTNLLTAFNAVTYDGFLPRYKGQVYKIMSDKLYSMDADSYQNIVIKRNIKLNKKITYFDSDASSQIERGELSLWMYSSSATETVSVRVQSRHYYYDM